MIDRASGPYAQPQPTYDWTGRLLNGRPRAGAIALGRHRSCCLFCIRGTPALERQYTGTPVHRGGILTRQGWPGNEDRYRFINIVNVLLTMGIKAAKGLPRKSGRDSGEKGPTNGPQVCLRWNRIWRPAKTRFPHELEPPFTGRRQDTRGGGEG